LLSLKPRKPNLFDSEAFAALSIQALRADEHHESLRPEDTEHATLHFPSCIGKAVVRWVSILGYVARPLAYTMCRGQHPFPIEISAAALLRTQRLISSMGVLIVDF
jgi:hypothetical protein